MMDPITIALALGKFAPDLIRWITGSDKAADVAAKAIDIAKTVTGQPTGDAALSALQADPALVLQYREAVLANQLEFEKLAAQNAADINKTMQAETTAEHWPSYSWRPAIGFAVAIDLVGAVVIVLVAYGGVIFFGVKPEMLSYLPGMLGSLAALVAVAAPILGIASWFRGKAQADPANSAENKG